MPRSLLVLVAILVTISAGSVRAASRNAAEPAPEVTVYGATPSGIAAALSAGRSGRRVLLLEPTGRIGGMVTNGLSHSDFHTFAGLTGTFLEFTQRVRAYYEEEYGADSPQVRACFRGAHGEPHVNLLIFRRMLAEQETIAVRTGLRLAEVRVRKDGDDQTTRIEAATFAGAEDRTVTVESDFWIDATYEGDLLAAAGVPYRVGREARSEYNESLAPETADDQVQGYNFRFVMTRAPNNRVRPAAPPGYDREDFLPLLELLENDRFKTVFCYPSGGIYKAHEPALPNNKHDINDVSRGLVRLSLPDVNDAWPDGDRATRRRIDKEHLRHNLGMLYFLQNDEAVPERFRREARQWGLCKDEFTENDHLPEQLYVREARRMVGRHVFTEHDMDHAPDDARSVLHSDAIALGEYGPNCHGTDHEGPRFGGRHTGEFYKRVPPYQIPYGVLVPRTCDNLLVPVACSASHVGFCALRLEPIWTSLGQAAGFAAEAALREAAAVQDVAPAHVRRRMHAAGAATIYVTDVPPDSPDFEAVQWWGAHGGLHGLAPRPERAGQRGAHIVSQYYEAYPGHAARLEEPLDNRLRQRWLKLARALNLNTEPLADAETRGAFLRRAFARAHHEKSK